MKFNKNSTLAKHMMNTVSEECGIDSALIKDERKSIDNEMSIMLEMEDNDFLKDCLVSRKKFYGRECDCVFLL